MDIDFRQLVDTRQRIQQVPQIDTELQERYNMMIGGAYAFLPSELKGIVSAAHNRKRNAVFGRDAAGYVRTELDRLQWDLPRDQRYGKTIIHVGGGRADDLVYVEKAVQLHMHTDVVDVSDIGCRYTEAYIKTLPDSDYLPVVEHADIEWVLTTEDQIDPESLAMIYFSRVVQGLDLPKMQRVQRTVGTVFQHNPDFRAVYVTPFGSNNPRVTWNRTTPYELAQLYEPLCEGAGHELVVVRPQTLFYYHQCYTAFTVVSPRGRCMRYFPRQELSDGEMTT